MKLYKYIALLVSVCVLLIGISGVAVVTWDVNNNRHQQLQELLYNQSEQISSEFLQSVDQIYALRSFVIGADGTANLNTIGSYLIDSAIVRNVLIAPEDVVTSVYPMKGNESVIGLDLCSKKNASYQDAILAKETRQLMLTGPYELKQGGEALSARLAVYLPSKSPEQPETYWGLVSVSVNFPAAFESTALQYLSDAGYCYRISKLDPKTQQYQSILERKWEDTADIEQRTFELYNMTLKIEAFPEDGWVTWSVVILSLMGMMVVSILVGLSVQQARGAHERLKEKATKDFLTGIYNRASGEKLINQTIIHKQYARGAFVLMDVDYFKNVNDTLGHQVGDRVLKESAQMLQMFCRNTDIVCRLGGDEFVLFLPFQGTDEFLNAKLTRILNAMQREVSENNQIVPISCSIGVVVRSLNGMDFENMYKMADEALYQSKENGRNRATFYEEQYAPLFPSSL